MDHRIRILCISIYFELTTAVANMITMVFGYAFHAAIGWIVNIMGGTDSSKAIVQGLIAIPLALYFGIVGISVAIPQGNGFE